MMKLYDNYLGYPTVMKLAFCDRSGEKKRQSAKCIVVVVRPEVLQRQNSYKKFLA